MKNILDSQSREFSLVLEISFRKFFKETIYLSLAKSTQMKRSIKRQQIKAGRKLLEYFFGPEEQRINEKWWAHSEADALSTSDDRFQQLLFLKAHFVLYPFLIFWMSVQAQKGCQSSYGWIWTKLRWRQNLMPKLSSFAEVQIFQFHKPPQMASIALKNKVSQRMDSGWASGNLAMPGEGLGSICTHSHFGLSLVKMLTGTNGAEWGSSHFNKNLGDLGELAKENIAQLTNYEKKNIWINQKYIWHMEGNRVQKLKQIFN